MSCESSHCLYLLPNDGFITQTRSSFNLKSYDLQNICQDCLKFVMALFLPSFINLEEKFRAWADFGDLQKE